MVGIPGHRFLVAADDRIAHLGSAHGEVVHGLEAEAAGRLAGSLVEIAFDLRSYLGYAGLKPPDLPGYAQTLGDHPARGMVVIEAMSRTRHRIQAGLLLHRPEHRIPVPSFQELVMEGSMLQTYPRFRTDTVDTS